MKILLHLKSTESVLDH